MTADITRTQLDSVMGFSVSDEQWDIIAAPLEPNVVVAGAGSGKTTSMAARVAYLVGSEYVTSEQVLGLTFTNKAAASLGANMRKVLRALDAAGLGPLAPDLGDDESVAGEPSVQTYNSFASRILSEHGIRLGREPGARVLTEGFREQLAYRVVCSSVLPLEAFGKGPESLTSDLLGLDDQCSELDISPERLIEWDSKLIDDMNAIELAGKFQKNAGVIRETAKKRRHLARLVLEWRAAKERYDVLDYTDQTRLALELVRRFPEVGQSVREQFTVVLLDEYQDTSIAQRRLLQELFPNGHAVTAVGDPCQAIYGWRGASVDNIEQFPQHFPALRNGVLAPARRYTLSANRRSGYNILKVANDLSQGLRSFHTGIEELKWADSDKGAGLVTIGMFERSSDERTWLVDRIANIGEGLQGKWGSIAILASNGRELAALDALLQARDIPSQLHGAAGLLNQPIIVDVRSMLEAVVDPVANGSVVRLLAGPRWAIGARDLAGLGKRAAQLAGGHHNVDPTTVAQALDAAVAGADPVEMTSLSDATMDLGDLSLYSPQAAQRLAEFGQELQHLRRYASEPLPEFLSRVLSVSGLDVELAMAHPQAQLAWMTFAALAADFTDLEGRSTLSAFLRRLNDAERFDVDLKVDVVQRADAVQLMTIHKAKGLEFPVVIVPGFVEGAFPGGNSRSRWMKSAAVIPWHLREDQTAELTSYPARDRTPTAKELDAYSQVLQDHDLLEDQRLAYVALTRAENTLIATGHWWGPTQQKARIPGRYLDQVRTTSDEFDEAIAYWHDEPLDEKNPYLEEGAGFTWPVALESPAKVQALAELVHAANTDEVFERTAQESEIVEQWDDDARVLLEEARRLREPVVNVQLPATVSASVYIRALREPELLARDLARPMPSPSSAASSRGTAFHAWVETQYGQQSLLDPDDLPGAGDHDIVSDQQLVELKAAFKNCVFANVTPVAVEQPFAMLVDGRVLRGRIDAVFETNGRFDVIDWKTGSAKSADAMQLALYRLAWSRIANVPLEQIDAGFLVVQTGELLRPQLPDVPTST
jgi:DNA helicase-2/ATP-dependent DNA helicase PcrA